VPVTGQQLRDSYLTPQMECYFRSKLPGTPESEVRIRIEEALKFLHMSSQIRGSIPVTRDIDEIWHLWILETQEYARLCASIPGSGFIHHRSDAFAQCCGASPADLDNDIEEDAGALANYVLNYGPFEPARVRFWRLADYLTSQGGMTVADLNSWILSCLEPTA
jgi:hypothetical protein